VRPVTEKQPEKKVGFFAKAKKTSRASLNELKKVHWPTKKELFTYTNVVLSVVVIMAVLIWVVDAVVGNVFGLLI
jgi:preprotein translocase subunit SecE